MKDIVRAWRHIPQRYTLISSKCSHCETVFFPKRVLCPECRRKGKLEDIQLKGAGKIYTYSVINTPTDDFKLIAPYVVAIVELDERVKITTQIVDCKIEDVNIGDEVEMVFRKIKEEGNDGVISYGYKFRLKNC